MRNAFLLLLVGFVAGNLLARMAPAHARDPYKKAFDKMYLKTEPSTPEETAFAAAAKKANCNLCHEGANRKNRNSYGKELSKLITAKDQKDTEKINSALSEIAKLKSNPDDPNSPTYGDLIAKGQLPCPPSAAPAASAAAPAEGTNP